jgi:outer membrane immunogenic protein
MKKFLVAGFAAFAFSAAPVLAADMPQPAPVYKAAPAPMFSWTGCYLGANVGGGWGNDGAWRDTVGVSHGGDDFGGVIGGGQVGCDYQNGPWVVGLAGMFDWSDLKGSAVDPFNAAFTAHTKVTMLDTATVRLGYAVDRTLWYVDGGAAWSRTDRSFTPSSAIACAPATCVTSGTTASGWTIGVGVEQMIAPNWSWKLEYNYAGFGSATSNPAVGGVNSPYTVKQNINTVLVGLNYRFGAAR